MTATVHGPLTGMSLLICFNKSRVGLQDVDDLIKVRSVSANSPCTWTLRCTYRCDDVLRWRAEYTHELTVLLVYRRSDSRSDLFQVVMSICGSLTLDERTDCILIVHLMPL